MLTLLSAAVQFMKCMKQHCEVVKHQRLLQGMNAQFVKHFLRLLAIIVRPREKKENQGNLEEVVKRNSHGRLASMCICNL